MQIASLEIKNFRGIRNGKIHFKKHSIIIGPNNCGKTTVIDALALALGRDRMVRTLTEHDFYGTSPSRTDRIHIIVTVSDFPSEEISENADWFGDGRAIPKWLDKNTGTLHPTKSNPDFKLSCQIAFSARYDHDLLEAETCRYFYDDTDTGDVFDDESYVTIPTRLIRDIGFFLVPASRSWDKVISFGSELFRRVVTSAGGPPSASVTALRDAVRNPATPLENDPNLRGIVDDINNEMAAFFSNAPKLKLRLTNTDNEGILDATVPHFSYDLSGTAIPSKRHGNGLVSLQWLLLLLQFGKLRAESSEGFIMALEEPELHIPPALQAKLVHRIQALSTQTILTTHSPTVASIADPLALSVVRKTGGELISNSLLESPIVEATPNALRKLFQTSRSDTVSALMHEIVLIPEGRIDFLILKKLNRTVDLREGWILENNEGFGINVGIIPTHDSSIEPTFDALKRIHPKICCLVDGDSAGVDYSEIIRDKNILDTKILRWHNGKTIEDVIGWILTANEQRSLVLLGRMFQPAPASISEFVIRLKSEDRSANGLKQSEVAYDLIMEIIYEEQEVNHRAQKLLSGIKDVVNGKPNALFTRQSSPNESIFVFTP